MSISNNTKIGILFVAFWLMSCSLINLPVSAGITNTLDTDNSVLGWSFNPTDNLYFVEFTDSDCHFMPRSVMSDVISISNLRGESISDVYHERSPGLQTNPKNYRGELIEMRVYHDPHQYFSSIHNEDFREISGTNEFKRHIMKDVV